MDSSAFEKDLTEILAKNSDIVKKCDPSFLQNYIHFCLKTENVVSPKKFNVSKTYSIFSYKNIKGFLGKTFLVLLLICGCLIVLKDTIYKRIEYIEEDVETFNKYMYLYRKWIVYLGLQDSIFLRKLNSKSCLIPNPLFKEDKSDCKCAFVLKKYKVQNIDSAKLNFREEGANTPYLVLNAIDYPISFTDIKSYVLDHVDEFKGTRGIVSTVNGPNIGREFTEIFAGDEPPRYSIVNWDFDNVNGARHTRPLFPRPKFIPQENEIGLERRILFFGQNSTSTPTQIEHLKRESGMMYYLQIWGSRRFGLTPLSKCRCKKNSYLAFTLKPGQMLVFHPKFQKLFSTQVKDNSYDLGYSGLII